tara:strand:- start:7 stop:171 length:165 start_codon:yes stop_codon:yes gene_type:complete
MSATIIDRIAAKITVEGIEDKKPNPRKVIIIKGKKRNSMATDIKNKSIARPLDD